MPGGTSVIAQDAGWREPAALLRLLVEYGAAAIGAVAVVIALWGVAVGLSQLIRLERSRSTGGDRARRAETLRHELGFYTLLTLNFLVASDVIETLVVPTLEHLGVLGAVTLIRIVTGLALARELRDAHTPEGPSHSPEPVARINLHASPAHVSKPLPAGDI